MAQTLSKEVITAAIEGFEAQQQRIADQIQELRSMLNGSGTQTSAPSNETSGKRTFSADAKRRMREAQQRRWAKVRGESGSSESPATTKAPRNKRKLSAAGRKAIQEALRKRWAARRAETQAAPVKKTGTTRKAKPKAPEKAA